ncbi:MAG: hypothetical protein CMM44_02880 [Rhodospirillaceae bacterium]|nr:hypothetical protein [Rhodospirillaceae bacterium]|tara:strand:+ start:7217 stop:7405 length:189 start_codon:yes stop_codon:yes gene_type:complete
MVAYASWTFSLELFLQNFFDLLQIIKLIPTTNPVAKIDDASFKPKIVLITIIPFKLKTVFFY